MALFPYQHYRMLFAHSRPCRAQKAPKGAKAKAGSASGTAADKKAADKAKKKSSARLPPPLSWFRVQGV